jgi:hypothetical protein
MKSIHNFAKIVRHSHFCPAVADQRSYTGTQGQCFCMCNGAVKMGIPVTRATWFPSGQFSSGGCGCCPGRKSLSNSESDASIVSDERVANATIVTHMLDTASIEKMKNGAFANQPGPFFLDKCFSAGRTYNGNYDSCVNFCKGYARQFPLGSWSVNFFPSGQFSTGGCSCCGAVDPCFN